MSMFFNSYYEMKSYFEHLKLKYGKKAKFKFILEEEYKNV